MCRLFGALGSGPMDLESHLVSSETSLLAQSNAYDKRIQGDGWGLGCYPETGKPGLDLSTGAIFEEKARFSAAVGKASGPVVIGHIREASNPMNLPRDRLLRIENQQPFTDGKWIFAHNGTLKLPAETLGKMGRYKDMMRGQNDSEVFFWLLMSRLEKTRSVREALAGSLKTIMEAWEEAPAEKREEARVPYVSLNFMLTDGKKLYAVCKYDGHRPKHQDNWLIAVDPPRPLLEMCYRLEPGGKCLVVASERTEPGGEWVPLRDGSLLTASLAGGKVKLKVEKL
jgi:predicted glutamine amidotransferase